MDEQMRQKLGFEISDNTYPVRVLTYVSGGCYPASDAEIALWDALAALSQPAAAQGDSSHPAGGECDRVQAHSWMAVVDALNRINPDFLLIEGTGEECAVREIERLASHCGGTKALADVAAERARQISVEGWTPEHDDEHPDGALAYAATSYAIEAAHLSDGMKPDDTRQPPFAWPWGRACWKPASAPRRNLVKAGALIVAEIERLDRTTAPKATP